MLYFAALNNPARTKPKTAEPITAPATLKTENNNRTSKAKVSRERRSLGLGGLLGHVGIVAGWVEGKGESGYDVS